MIQPIVHKVIGQLKKKSLTQEDRVALINCLLEKLDTVPIGDMILTSAGGLMVNGKELDQEQVISFKEACVSLRDNFARRVIKEQIKFEAIKLGIHNSTSIDTLMFSKAVLWTIAEEEKLIYNLTNL